MEFQYRTPAWQTPIDRADRVELFALPQRKMISAAGWPQTFWPHVGVRVSLAGPEAAGVIALVGALEPGISARCHMPPWGFALYAGDALLFTASLCFACSNAYVFTAEGNELRAFDPSGPNARALRRVLEQHLPLRE
jgi:hypothetical protein